MRHCLAVFILGAIIVGATLAAAAQAAPHELRGTAVAVSDGRVLYTELHRWQDDWHRAEYRAPDGTLFATSELDYSPGRAQPAFVQTNVLTGDRQGARWQGSTLTLFSGRHSEVVAYREPLVISSGFNNFVLAHWDEFLGAGVLSVDFAVPEHLAIVRLKIHRIAVAQTTIANPDPAWIYLRVQAANAILAWFVPPVGLAYSSDRYLRVYRGTSNVEIAGKSPAVEVRY